MADGLGEVDGDGSGYKVFRVGKSQVVGGYRSDCAGPE